MSARLGSDKIEGLNTAAMMAIAMAKRATIIGVGRRLEGVACVAGGCLGEMVKRCSEKRMSTGIEVVEAGIYTLVAD